MPLRLYALWSCIYTGVRDGVHALAHENCADLKWPRSRLRAFSQDGYDGETSSQG